MSSIGDFVSSRIGMLNVEIPSNRAMLAKLRQAVGKPPGARVDIFEITLEGAPQGERASKAIHVALTLYGVHKLGTSGSMNDRDVTFGAAIGKLVERDNSNITAVKRRFDTIATASSLEEVAHHARGLIQMLRSKDIRFDYAKFAQDLHSFQDFDGADRIRLRWGQDFYRQIQSNKEKGGNNDE